jgi:hypothetical protein
MSALPSTVRRASRHRQQPTEVGAARGAPQAAVSAARARSIAALTKVDDLQAALDRLDEVIAITDTHP